MNQKPAEEAEHAVASYRLECLLEAYFTCDMNGCIERIESQVVEKSAGWQTVADKAKVRKIPGWLYSIAAVVLVGLTVWWIVHQFHVRDPGTGILIGTTKITPEEHSRYEQIDQYSLELMEGTLNCQTCADKSFAIYTDIATVNSKNATFKTTIKGEKKMRRLIITVITGTVIASGVWGEEVIKAGETREIKSSRKEPRAKVDVSAKIEGVKDSYILTAESLDQDDSPSPVVDLKLVLTNNGTEDFTFTSVSSDSTTVDLTLEGQGAKLIEYLGQTTAECRGGKTIVIKPGESHTIQIKDLSTGERFLDKWLCTCGGTYTLSATLKTGSHTFKTEPVTLKFLVRPIPG